MWANYPEINEELKAVEAYIKENCKSRNRLLADMVSELVDAGGKRLRPAFVVISSKFGKRSSRKVVKMAAAMEILHTATLVHDDIVDRAKTRRGKTTVSEKYGIDMAVYVGDFLFTKAVLALSTGVPVERLGEIAGAVRTICEGEVDQYQQRNNIDTSVMSYLKRAGRKTAALFSAACGMGAFLAKCPLKVSRNLARFGYYYGMAFQMRDDLDDFIPKQEGSGKPVWKDISEGVVTLPVIYAMSKNPKVREEVSCFLGKKDCRRPEDLARVVDSIRQNGGIKAAELLLERYIRKGLDILEKLPDNRYRTVLKELITGLG